MYATFGVRIGTKGWEVKRRTNGECRKLWNREKDEAEYVPRPSHRGACGVTISLV